MIFVPLLFEPGIRRHPCELAEVAIERLFVGETHLEGYYREFAFTIRTVVSQYQFLSVSYAEAVHIVGEGAVQLLINVVRDVGAAGTHLARYVRQGDVLLQII